MKIEPIRQAVSQYLDILIPDNQWEEKLDVLDREGSPTKKQMLGLFLILFKHVEALENKISGQEAQFNRLRTGEDVISELSKKQGPHYVTSSDWDLLKKRADNPLTKNDPRYGVGKEIDPRDNKQKVCFYVNDSAIFRV